MKASCKISPFIYRNAPTIFYSSQVLTIFPQRRNNRGRTEMVSRFRRTLSFPTKPNPSRPSPPEKSYHVRSISLPCRSHPLISDLESEIQDLRTWEKEAAGTADNNHRTSAWACHGLIRLKSLHDSVEDLLQLPQTQDSLRRRSDWVEKLLEDSLRFVDVYGIFRAALVALNEEQSAVQVAVRRRDESKIASYVKARKKMDKEMKKLVSVVRNIGRRPVPSGSLLLVDGNAELAAILRDVYDVTVSVTIAVLNGVSGSSAVDSNYWIAWKKNKKSGEKRDARVLEFEDIDAKKLLGLRMRGTEEMRRMLKKMQEMENCIGGMESGSEGVFRSFISARVSLLNILTQ